MGRDDYSGKSSYPTMPTNSISYRPRQTNIPPLLLGQNVEMASLTQNGSQFGRQGDPNAILNECREVDSGINEIENTLQDLKTLQKLYLNDSDTSPKSKTLRNVELKEAQIMQMTKNLVDKVKSIKQKPESGTPRNAPQVGKVDRKLKSTMNDYQQVDRDFRGALRDQTARQYLLVNPNANEAEVNRAVDNPMGNQQVFANAMMNSTRRGQVEDAASAVKGRHEAIQKIEQQMIELSDLFQNMDNLVVQQEAAVVNIEQKGEEVVENMDKGTEQIGVAIKSARNRNKLKWWCLGITSTFPFAILLFTYSTNRYFSQS